MKWRHWTHFTVCYKVSQTEPTMGEISLSLCISNRQYAIIIIIGGVVLFYCAVGSSTWRERMSRMPLRHWWSLMSCSGEGWENSQVEDYWLTLSLSLSLSLSPLPPLSPPSPSPPSLYLTHTHTISTGQLTFLQGRGMFGWLRVWRRTEELSEYSQVYMSRENVNDY